MRMWADRSGFVRSFSLWQPPCPGLEMRFWLWLTVALVEYTSPSRGARGSCHHPPQRQVDRLAGHFGSSRSSQQFENSSRSSFQIIAANWPLERQRLQRNANLKMWSGRALERGRPSTKCATPPAALLPLLRSGLNPIDWDRRAGLSRAWWSVPGLGGAHHAETRGCY